MDERAQWERDVAAMRRAVNLIAVLLAVAFAAGIMAAVISAI